MAKLRSGIIENLTGSIGDLSFYKWKNKFVIRAKRSSPTKPPTEAQLLSREKFKFLGKLFPTFSDISDIGFKSHTSSMTTKNAFFKYNYSSILKKEDELYIDYPELVLSQGALKNVQILQTKSEPNSFSLIWKNKPDVNRYETIHITLITLKENCLPILFENSITEESAIIPIPDSWRGNPFHAYAFTKNQKEEVSNSQYLGEFS